MLSGWAGPLKSKTKMFSGELLLIVVCLVLFGEILFEKSFTKQVFTNNMFYKNFMSLATKVKSLFS